MHRSVLPGVGEAFSHGPPSDSGQGYFGLNLWSLYRLRPAMPFGLGYISICLFHFSTLCTSKINTLAFSSLHYVFLPP